jgi:N-acetylglucosaminyldiphosphoundecaprenol N-acetyl-beta-D-mannosaminyltransferase
VIDRERRREIMGVGIDCVRHDEVVEHVFRRLAEGRGGRIVTPNVDILRQVNQYAELRNLIESADVVVADGAPLVWASRLQGTPLPERIAGATLLGDLCTVAGFAHRRVFLLGGAPGVAALAARRLRAAMPELECGSHCPPLGFEHSRDHLRELVGAIAAARADVVFCGFGFPKQERLMARLCEVFPRAWFCAAGGALAFTAGVKPRAPEWVQQAGFEWLHRLVHEPDRLFARYVVHDMPFAVQLLGHSLRRRLAPAA